MGGRRRWPSSIDNHMAGAVPLKRPVILLENAPPEAALLRNRNVLDQFFHLNVVEVKFRRRILPPYFKKNREPGHGSYWRRMLCTSNWPFLFSSNSNPWFNPQRPKSRRGPEWYRSRGLVITFDIFNLDYRMVSLDTYAIVGYIPLKTLMERAEFVAFYRQFLKNIPEGKKQHFSDL